MTKGHIKLHRVLQDSDVFKDPHLTHLFIWCVLRAKWADCTDSKYRIKLKRGQLVCNERDADKYLESIKSITVDARTFDRRINALIDMGNLARHRHGHNTIITVVNYEKYQCNHSDIDDGELPFFTNECDVSKGNQKDTLPIAEIIESYITHLPNHKRNRWMDGSRKIPDATLKHIKSFYKRCDSNMDAVDAYFAKVASWRHIQGHNVDGWKPDFAFLIGKINQGKIDDDKYDDENMAWSIRKYDNASGPDVKESTRELMKLRGRK